MKARLRAIAWELENKVELSASELEINVEFDSYGAREQCRVRQLWGLVELTAGELDSKVM